MMFFYEVFIYIAISFFCGLLVGGFVVYHLLNNIKPINTLPFWDMKVDKLPAICCVCGSEKEVGTATVHDPNNHKWIVCYSCYIDGKFLEWLQKFGFLKR
jgi:hypothetical protein